MSQSALLQEIAGMHLVLVHLLARLPRTDLAAIAASMNSGVGGV